MCSLFYRLFFFLHIPAYSWSLLEDFKHSELITNESPTKRLLCNKPGWFSGESRIHSHDESQGGAHGRWDSRDHQRGGGSMPWVHAVGPCRGSMPWVHTLGPCRGSIPWVHAVGPYRGSMPWVHTVGPYLGSMPWVHTMGPYRGSIPWVHAVGPCRGSIPWVHAVGPCRGSILWVHARHSFIIFIDLYWFKWNLKIPHIAAVFWMVCYITYRDLIFVWAN